MSVTITELAGMIGVSKSTVHRALSGSGQIREELKQQILTCAEAHQYMPNMSARVLVGARTYMTAIIARDFGNVHFSQFLKGAGDTAAAANYHLLTVSREEELNNLRQSGLEGVISFFWDIKSGPLKNQSSFPLIHLNKVMPQDSGENDISIEVLYGAELIMRHLLEKGHRRIGHITVTQPDDPDKNPKQAGYRGELKKAGIKYDPSLLVKVRFYREYCGYEGAMKLLRRPDRPTAIFAMADVLAVGCYRAARELNLRIPEDISICGYDDKEYASYLYPALTTIRPPFGLLGQRAMEMLIHRIEKRCYPSPEPLFPELIERGSVAAPSEKSK